MNEGNISPRNQHLVMLIDGFHSLAGHRYLNAFQLSLVIVHVVPVPRLLGE